LLPNAAGQRQRALGFTGKSIDAGDAEQLRIGKYRRALCPLHWLVIRFPISRLEFKAFAGRAVAADGRNGNGWVGIFRGIR
jgi:hypothetical protein